MMSSQEKTYDLDYDSLLQFYQVKEDLKPMFIRYRGQPEIWNAALKFYLIPMEWE